MENNKKIFNCKTYQVSYSLLLGLVVLDLFIKLGLFIFSNAPIVTPIFTEWYEQLLAFGIEMIMLVSMILINLIVWIKKRNQENVFNYQFLKINYYIFSGLIALDVLVKSLIFMGFPTFSGITNIYQNLAAFGIELLLLVVVGITKVVIQTKEEQRIELTKAFFPWEKILIASFILSMVVLTLLYGTKFIFTIFLGENLEIFFVYMMLMLYTLPILFVLFIITFTVIWKVSKNKKECLNLKKLFEVSYYGFAIAVFLDIFGYVANLYGANIPLIRVGDGYQNLFLFGIHLVLLAIGFYLNLFFQNKEYVLKKELYWLKSILISVASAIIIPIYLWKTSILLGASMTLLVFVMVLGGFVALWLITKNKATKEVAL